MYWAPFLENDRFVRDQERAIKIFRSVIAPATILEIIIIILSITLTENAPHNFHYNLPIVKFLK